MGACHEHQYIFFYYISLSSLQSEKCCGQNFVEKKQNTHFNLKNFFSRKSKHLWDNVEKYCIAGQVKADNMALAHSMTDTGYRHTQTLRIFDIHCFPTATMVTRTLINITLQFLISNFRRVLNVVCFLLGNSPASEFYMPTFRNTQSVPSS